jgi:hypothetical protein
MDIERESRHAAGRQIDELSCLVMRSCTGGVGVYYEWRLASVVGRRSYLDGMGPVG